MLMKMVNQPINPDTCGDFRWMYVDVAELLLPC